MNSSTCGSKEARTAFSIVCTLCCVSGRCCVSEQPPFCPCDCTEPWHYGFTLQSKQYWDHTKATAQKGTQGQRLPEQKGCRKAQNESEGTNCNDKSERMLEMGEGQRKVCCFVGNKKKKEVTRKLTCSVVPSHKQGGTQKLSMLHFNRCLEKSKIKERKPFRHLRNVEVIH